MGQIDDITFLLQNVLSLPAIILAQNYRALNWKELGSNII